ncbi:alpha-amylase [bacterium]|nr:alpha-amylase [bacterium]
MCCLSACKPGKQPQTESMETTVDSAETTELEALNKGEFVPQWAKQVVWYQIFPERFRNGDPSNDPTAADIVGADPQEAPKEWHIHPWGSDWFQLQDYEKANGEKELWKHLLRRRYGGDIQGIIDQLDYLQELGITALYLNPVFDAPSLHKYDGASYHHIDPNFGPDPAGDRQLMQTEDPSKPNTWVWTKADLLALQLIEEAHKRGMKIIFDGVFNHMGINSFAFKDLKKNQQNSKYKDWFTVKSYEDPAAGTHFAYEGWWGVPSLPELREDSNGIVAGPRDYIFAATERWMNPQGKGTANGIDGWRLDVAFCVGHPFWKQWRQQVRSINPQAYLTAEIVDVPEKVIPYMQGDEFDGEMNYNFAFTCTEFFVEPDAFKIPATEFDKKLKQLRKLYPKGVAYVCQNLLGSHDANRISSYIKNRGIGSYRDWGSYFSLSKAAENPNYSPRKPSDEDYELQKLLVIMQMTYVGAPMIYYGDEVGMWGGNDPDCRKPMWWPDIAYSPEKYLPNQSTHQPDAVEINKKLFKHYQKMIAIRKAHPALQTGDYKTIVADDDLRLFGFERTNDSETIRVVFNNASTPQTYSIKGPAEQMTDLISGNIYAAEAGTIAIEIPAKWAVVLL